MDSIALVDVDDGQELINILQDLGIEIRVAFWTKLDGESTPYLYIASDLVDDKGLGESYIRINRVLRKHPELISLKNNVRMISASDPMANAALKVIQPKIATGRFSVQNPLPYPGITRFNGSSLGGVNIDGTTPIYHPKPVATS